MLNISELFLFVERARKARAGENKVRSVVFIGLFYGFAVTASLRRGGARTERAEVSGKRGGCPPNFQPPRQFASLAGRSSVAERRLEVGSDFFEGAPPSAKTSALRERAPANRGFPLHRVPFLRQRRAFLIPCCHEGYRLRSEVHGTR